MLKTFVHQKISWREWKANFWVEVNVWNSYLIKYPYIEHIQNTHRLKELKSQKTQCKMAKDMETSYIPDTQSTNMKRCSASLITRGMQIKIIVLYYYIYSRMTTVKEDDIPNVRRSKDKLVKTSWKTIWQYIY